MTSWMGNLHDMVAVACMAQLGDTAHRPGEVVHGIGASFGYYSDRVTRTWSLATSQAATPAEMGTLQAMHQVGQPPCRLITCSAAVVNVLPPASSVGPTGWSAVTGEVGQGGPVETVDGLAYGSISHAGAAATPQVTSPTFPVAPGRPLSVSAYCRAKPGATNPRLRLEWVNASGGTVSAGNEAITSGSAPLARQSVTVASVPGNRRAARLVAFGASQIAMPAATYTATPEQWGMGEGAEAVMFAPDYGRSVTLAIPGRHYSGHTLSLMEL